MGANTGSGTRLDSASDDNQRVPSRWHRFVAERLEPGEAVVAWFLPDLDIELNYAESLVVLTNRRLVGYTPPPGAVRDGEPADGKFDAWRLEDIESLRTRDRSGLGTLDLEGHDGPLARWRYTVGRAAGAERVAQLREAVERGECEEDDAWYEAAGEKETSTTLPTAGAPFRLARLRAATGRADQPGLSAHAGGNRRGAGAAVSDQTADARSSICAPAKAACMTCGGTWGRSACSGCSPGCSRGARES